MRDFSITEQESILIGDDITVRVLEICDDTVILGIERPNDTSASGQESVDHVDQEEELVCRPR